MGIHDRDYYRREGPSLFGSLTPGRVCKWIIILTIVVFIVQLATIARAPISNIRIGHGAFTEALLLDPDKVVEGQVWRLLTYAFLHDTSDPLHIIFNLLVLWL